MFINHGVIYHEERTSETFSNVRKSLQWFTIAEIIWFCFLPYCNYPRIHFD